MQNMQDMQDMKQAAEFFKLLADESRLEILWLLLNHEELCVCELIAALEMSQSKVSRHLACLRHAGLVSYRKQGLWSHYSLCPPSDETRREQLALLKQSFASLPRARELLRRIQEQQYEHC